ncbi:MAG: competence/damage-inducible protein A [Bacillota bacterium]|nr:competence/damage-inducible protein A [Bacillota bacterium]
MKAEILAVGTEILLGDIVNTNAQYLANRLKELGIFVYYQGVVGDNTKRLIDELGLAFKRSDLVITTGGLGPTKDDLTKEAAAEYFNKKLILNEEELKKIEEYFNRRNIKITENNRKQALIPEGALVLVNPNGTAPGCIIEEDGRILVILPGPPNEMKSMYENTVLPYLEKKQECTLVSKTLRMIGIPEGTMADRVSSYLDLENPTVAPYAKDNDVILRITAKARDLDAGKKILEPVVKELRSILGEFIYGEDEDAIEDVLGAYLTKNNIKIATAESCTGGLLAGRIINYPGISAVFGEGYITYSNEAKVKNLGVSEKTLAEFGAVSKETAMEMAKGAALKSGADLGISTTGIAGPTGGTPEKIVGLVYVGLYYNGITKYKELKLSGNRQKVRSRAVNEALSFTYKELR